MTAIAELRCPVASRLSPSGYWRRWIHNSESSASPKANNGELEFSQLLESRGETVLYEPEGFELKSWQPFIPDLLALANDRHPDVYFEITWLDKGLAETDAKISQLLTEPVSKGRNKQLREWMGRRADLIVRLERKYGKIDETNDLHQTPVVAIPYARWVTIMANPSLLDRWLDRRSELAA